MSSFDQPSGETATPMNDHDGDSRQNPSRILEVAARTADQLVADARTEAESLVTTAQATAQQIGEASRDEAARMADELSRTRAEQTAELESERATALGQLAEEKANLESQIAALREMEADQRDQVRRLLTEHLARLDSGGSGSSADGAE